jgi:hypothetical protein
MPVIYELRDEEQAALSFHATRKDAIKEQKWWTDEGGAETTIHPIEYLSNTRAGIVALLNRIATTGP